MIESAIDAATASAIVNAAESAGFRATDRDYPPSYRDNDRLVHDDPALAMTLFERLGALLPQRLVDRQGAVWELACLNDRFRFCRYENGQSFRVHRDGAHAPSGELRSHLTLQIYLDDGFRGGRTRFYASRSGSEIGAVTPTRGRAIVFDHQLWHDGEPVTEGVKHVLRADVMYRRSERKPKTSAPEANVLRAHGGYVFALAMLADGSLVSGSRDRTVRRFEERGGSWIETHVIEAHTASIHTLVEAKPGIVWSGSRDRTIRTTDLATGVSSVVATIGGSVLALARVRDDVIVAGCADSKVHVFDVDGVERGSIAGHQGWVWSVTALDELDLFASGSEDGTLRVHHIDGRFIASASPGRGPVHAVVSIDERGGAERGATKGSGRPSVVPIGERRIAAGFADGHVIIYLLDSARGTLDAIDLFQAHHGEIYALAAKDGLLATAGEDEHARVFRLEGGGGCALLEHDDFVRSAVWLADGRLATASYDGAIRFFFQAEDAR